MRHRYDQRKQGRDRGDREMIRQTWTGSLETGPGSRNIWTWLGGKEQDQADRDRIRVGMGMSRGYRDKINQTRNRSSRDRNRTKGDMNMTRGDRNRINGYMNTIWQTGTGFEEIWIWSEGTGVWSGSSGKTRTVSVDTGTGSGETWTWSAETVHDQTVRISRDRNRIRQTGKWLGRQGQDHWEIKRIRGDRNRIRETGTGSVDTGTGSGRYEQN